MPEKSAPTLCWIGILTNLQKKSLEQGVLCYSRLHRRGIMSPWLYFFDILTDKNNRFCFLQNDRSFQETILSFIEQNSNHIPKYLLHRFSHNLTKEGDLKRFRYLAGNVACDVSDAGLESKRKLSSPELPSSKHICLEKRRSESSLSVDVTPVIIDQEFSKTEDVSDLEKSEEYNVKLLSVEDMLQLDDIKLISHLTTFSRGYDDSDKLDSVNYDDLSTILKRTQNSPVALQNFVHAAAVPFLAGKKVCTRSDSAILTECFDNDEINCVNFVTDILRRCKKQIIDGTAKVTILKPAKIDDILFGFVDMKKWSEYITAFLLQVVSDTNHVNAIVTVLQYLLNYSDEKSSKSCTLVMRILNSYGSNETIIELCTQFAERSKCFLKKTLLQKIQALDDV